MVRLLVVTSLVSYLACGVEGSASTPTHDADVAVSDGSANPTLDASAEHRPDGSAETTTSHQCPGEPHPHSASVEPFERGVCEPQPLGTPPPTSQADVNGSSFVYTQLEQPKALMLIFHGGGGDMHDLIHRVEGAIFAQRATSQGVVIASLNSEAHITAPQGPKYKWNIDPTPCNPDIVNVTAMVKRLMDPDDLNAVPPGAPIFALGVSNGGSMVSRTAQHMRFSAVASYISNAQSFHEQGALIPPVVIVAGQNDGTVGTQGPCMLLDKAAIATFHLNSAAPLTSGSFTRIPGIDCTLSQSIFTALLDNGVLTEAYFIDQNPTMIQSWSPHIPEAAKPYLPEIRDLLLERFGEHSFTSEFDEDTLDFLWRYASPSEPSDLATCDTP